MNNILKELQSGKIQTGNIYSFLETSLTIYKNKTLGKLLK